MKRGSTVFLQSIIIIIALGVLTGLIWFPQTEGRAVGLDLLHIYTDPFTLYIYLGSVPFFVGLFQAFKLLQCIEANAAFTPRAVTALKNIKIASLVLIACIAGAELYIRFFSHGDDIAGPTMLGICLSVVFGVIATVAGIFQRLFQNAVDLQSENDLTV